LSHRNPFFDQSSHVSRLQTTTSSTPHFLLLSPPFLSRLFSSPIKKMNWKKLNLIQRHH
jgi:hypothetical protein